MAGKPRKTRPAHGTTPSETPMVMLERVFAVAALIAKSPKASVKPTSKTQK